MIVKRLVPALAALLVAAITALGAGAATGSNASAKGAAAKLGIFDEAQTLYGNPDYAFPVLYDLRAQIVRSHLYWGGKYGVAKRRPSNPYDYDDPAYNWDLYERQVQYASHPCPPADKCGPMDVVFSIYGTPSWAGGKGLNTRPKSYDDLMDFATAAAAKFPMVKYWIAWNEPNNPIFLKPQFAKVKGKWVPQAAITYAQICNAVVKGVRRAKVAGQKVACGATAPRGSNRPTGTRPAIPPLFFLRHAKKAGMTNGFDAWATHPYYGSPSESPAKKPRGKGAITLGNINTLIAEVTKLYGAKKRIWITEYGFQTRPEDTAFGVTYAQQAAYLKQAWTIVRRNPRIDMMLWFMLHDDTNVRLGWQSGLLTYTGERKPAYDVFKALPHQ